ncbi:MAG: methylmalonyl-CoA mutase [Deltaproteobacteria bacterium]|nr:MAG: methylmalonyl-CoA mutase [Deltaproteobacteria bacterium]
MTEKLSWEKAQGKSWAFHEPIKEKYGPRDMEGIDYERDIGEPGRYPYTRGIYPSGYRSRLWTMRPIMAYGSPEDTRDRIEFLSKEGATTPQIVPDIATVNVLDSDHPLARHGVGMQGMPFSSLRDMERLLDGIPIEKRNFNLVFNTCVTPILFSQYLVVAERRRLDISKFRGTISNEPLKSRWSGYEAAARYFDLAMKLSGDVSEYCIRNMPLYTCLNINTSDAVSAGASPGFVMGKTLAIGLEHIREAVRRGLKVEDLASRMAMVGAGGTGINFFETVASVRAARKVWARIMKEKFNVEDPRASRLRIGGLSTWGIALYPQEPLNNIVRLTIGAMADIMGGVQSLAVVGYDEPIAIPTEESHRMSLRIQQILAFESGIADTVDPLAGSYYVEALTRKIEDEAMAVIEKIEGMGGIGGAIKWLDQEMEKAVQKSQQEILKGERPIVGVNIFNLHDEGNKGVVTAFKVPPGVAEKQINALKELRQTRDNNKVVEAIEKLYEKAQKKQENLIPYIKEAVKAYATIGEIYGTIQEAYGYPYDAFGMLQSPFKH